MASNPIGRQADPVTLPDTIIAISDVASILRRYDRPRVEAVIELAIAMLDAADPDPDIELNGDEEERSGDEEPGAYAEWSSLLPARRRAGACVINACGHEDDEEDDPGEEDDHPGEAPNEDNANTMMDRVYEITGPGCEFSDPGEDDGSRDEVMLKHRDRIRRTRCEVTQTRWGKEYRYAPKGPRPIPCAEDLLRQAVPLSGSRQFTP